MEEVLLQAGSVLPAGVRRPAGFEAVLPTGIHRPAGLPEMELMSPPSAVLTPPIP